MRIRQRLGNAGGLKDFGVNLMRLPPGGWSSQRHWHSHEDEFVFVIEGELTLVEDGGETVLRAGDCAAFPRRTPGTVIATINRSDVTAVYLEVGSRSPDDLTTCSDIDMMSPAADGRFLHKDGAPYPEPKGAILTALLMLNAQAGMGGGEGGRAFAKVGSPSCIRCHGGAEDT